MIETKMTNLDLLRRHISAPTIIGTAGVYEYNRLLSNLNPEERKIFLDAENERSIQRFRKILNKKIEREIDDYMPKILITQTLMSQFKYSAKKVSEYFNENMELSGVCVGKQLDNNILLTDFVPFHDQECSNVRTIMRAKGKIKTYSEIEKQKVEPFFTAHSHNKMDVFHSHYDDELLKNELNYSPKRFQFKLDCMLKPIPVEYFTSIVFNERGELYSKTYVKVPQVIDGKLETIVKEVSPQITIVDVKNSYQRRLEKQIRSRVYKIGA